MAYPPEQRYKEGNYILEQNLIERHQGLCPTKTKEKDGSSSPSNTVYNPARYETTHYAISNSRHSFASEPFADFSRFLNRAVVLNNYNEFNQRVQSRHSARLRRAHLPSWLPNLSKRKAFNVTSLDFSARYISLAFVTFLEWFHFPRSNQSISIVVIPSSPSPLHTVFNVKCRLIFNKNCPFI